jgi:hypothetical protein
VTCEDCDFTSVGSLFLYLWEQEARAAGRKPGLLISIVHDRRHPQLVPNSVLCFKRNRFAKAETVFGEEPLLIDAGKR